MVYGVPDINHDSRKKQRRKIHRIQHLHDNLVMEGLKNNVNDIQISTVLRGHNFIQLLEYDSNIRILLTDVTMLTTIAESKKRKDCKC